MSFASVILSYFLVGGGLFTGTLLSILFEIHSEVVGYLLLGGGAFVGGFIAARASRGSTIVEPAIGAVAVVATIVGLAATTEIGKLMWGMAHDQTLRLVAGVGLTSLVGAMAGAFLSERMFGEATESGLPWILYTAFSAFGACLIALMVVAVLAKGESDSAVGVRGLAAMAGGCLLAGMAVGASARSRPLGAAFLGGGLGVVGFAYLSVRLATGGLHGEHSGDMVAALGILGGGGAVVTLLGALIGWGAFGKNG